MAEAQDRHQGVLVADDEVADDEVDL
ncbi:hypothetical protein CSPAE12_05868 [Colletotrichum incanum]|nr:hypothetical protein CSPAE12_05868 [Colletotrichum incanum]